MENSNPFQNKFEKTDIFPSLTKQTSLPSYGEVLESENQYASEALENFDGKLKTNCNDADKKERSDLKVMDGFFGK